MYAAANLGIFRARLKRKSITFIMYRSSIEIIMAETQKRAKFGMFDSSSARAVRLNAILINDMEEIYDKEVLQASLERIENMTVKEIRSSLPKGYAFVIYGDSHWAILTDKDLSHADH